MSYRNLTILKPSSNNQYVTSNIPAYCPSPRAYDTITRKDLLELQQKNRDLVKKLKETEQAPQLMSNLVLELAQADTRVKELQTMLNARVGDDQKEARADQLTDSNKRVRKLATRLEEANRKNRGLEIQMNTKRNLVRDFNRAVKDMDEVLEKLAYTKHRSKILEDTLIRAREKERELRRAKMNLKDMQNELEGANRQLQKLGTTLVTANDRWNKRPRNVTRVKVDSASVGLAKAEHTDVYGRATRDVVKVVEVKDKGIGNVYAKDGDYTSRSNKEIDLIRSVSELETSNATADMQNTVLADENRKLAAEVQTLIKAMQNRGITLTPEQMGGRK